MAKILKPGREQKGWAKRYKCTGKGNGEGGCGALLQIEAGDIFRTESHARDETTSYATFQCPQCGVWTDVYNSDYGGDRNSPPDSVISGAPYRSPSTQNMTHAEWLESRKKKPTT